MSYNLISKYRTELMGLAIIWIFLFHSKISFPDHFIFHPFRLILATGYGGVDIFFFLSGFGLMHHMLNQNSSYFTFYKKRFTKILPPYFLATSITFFIDYLIYGTISIKEFLLCLSTIGFWTNQYMFYWFIPSIISLYLIYPLFYRAYLKYEFSFIITAIFLSFVTCLLLIYTENNHFIILISRIPIFILGSHIGYLSLNKKTKITRNKLYLHSVIFFSFIIMLTGVTLLPHDLVKNSGLGYYVFTIGTFSLCFLASLLLELVSLSSKKYLSLLFFCGTISLEIYLVHKQIVFKFGEYFLPRLSLMHMSFLSLYSTRLIEYFAYFIITVLIALQLNKVSESISARINQT